MRKTGLYLLIALVLGIGVIVFVTQNPFEKEAVPPSVELVDGGVEGSVEEASDADAEEDGGSIDKLADTIAKMTLEEKVGQVVIAGFQGTRITEAAKELIDTYKVGGFIFFGANLETPTQSLQLLNEVKQANVGNKFPLLLSVDQEGGRVTRLPGIGDLPTNAQIGLQNDTEYGYKYGELLGKQLHAYGFGLNFAPSLDVFSNPENEVIGDRSFGSDPRLVADIGWQVVKGMAAQGIIASVKHFPGHGDTQMDSHVGMPVVEKELAALNELELIPFRAAVSEGVDVVMTAHILLPALDEKYPATLSERIVTGVLRDDLGFDGVVITDDMTMGAITEEYDIPEAAVLAINAGVDMVLVAHDHAAIVKTMERLVAAVESGEITEERLDASVRRIVQLKEKYALTDEVVESIDLDYLEELREEMVR